ncbi:MAG: nuclear transport factor 2 family protein [Candidatus Riflebacteria bacterium]|nr:nuclear transport factor 2 family protein [Candidatus Riflebacteria bacterium]
MQGVPATKLERMYSDHIGFILKKDVEALLDQYTDDCLLISSFEKKPKYFRGKVELREHMNGILGIQGLETSVRFWAETDNTLMVTENIKLDTPDGPAKMIFADSWVLRDGKIAIHFAGMVQYPDGTLA